MKYLKSLFSFVAALTISASGYSNPGDCSGSCWSHDPSVIRRESDGTYFRFETGSKIGIWKADDLVGPWTYQGAMLPAGSKINLAGNDDLWAPDVKLVGSTYILYYSVSTFGSQNSAVGYATSSTLEYGSWTDGGSTGVASTSAKPYNAIDANLVEDQSTGRYFLNFGSFWGDIYQVAMSSDAKSASGSSYQIAYNASGDHALEGSYIYYRSGYYYLFFTNGICCGYDISLPAAGEEYSIHICRSQTISGPYVDKAGSDCMSAGGGSVLLSSHDNVYGPGGCGVMADPSRGTVLYYHYADKTIGLADSEYQFGWNILSWSSGWPAVT